MSAVDNSCLKCKGETEAGFVHDTVSATVQHPPYWIEGMPEPDSFLSGYAGRRMRTVNKVLRCKTCGYLEYYASGELLYA
jgi:hypothetical protein